MLTINPKKETERIVSFFKKTFAKQKINLAVIGISGGIDSTTSLYVLKQALSPDQISAIHLPYTSEPTASTRKLLAAADLPASNVHILSIRDTVNNICDELNIPPTDTVRRGNIMARVRMLYLFDFAKKLKALVVGTENRSEHYLGYFTRFGDAASDIEPLLHLYKTQVKQLAAYLTVPQEIITQIPTAGLWPGQTDEKEFGFTYEEADEVLYYYFEKKQTVAQIKKLGYIHTEQILSFANKHAFKHKTPYSLVSE